MINSKLSAIRNSLVKEITSIPQIEIMHESTNEGSIEIKLMPSFLSLTITPNDITVFYASEHDEFWRVTYETEKKWINAALSHIAELATNTVFIEYFYQAYTKKLLYYKVWINHQNNYNKLLKKVLISWSPLTVFIPKTKESKVIHRNGTLS